MTTFTDKIVELYNSIEYQKLSDYYKSESFFNTLRISRDEATHSNFIAWLLNPESNHGLSDFPMKKFLQMLAIAKRRENNKDASFDNNDITRFIIEDYSLGNHCNIVTERPVQGNKKNGRIDILITVDISIDGKEKTLPILIENKVLSKEHDKQTETYYEWGQKAFPHGENDDYKGPLCVFISPGFGKTINCDCKNFINVSYQDFVDYVIDPCMRNNPKEEAVILIKNYLRCLSYSDITGTDDGKKRKIMEKVMAYSSEEKELLESFYTKNKDLFGAVIAMLSEDTDIPEDERKKLKAVNDIVSKRDYSKYVFKGHEYGKNRCVWAVVKDAVESKEIKTYKELLELFPDELQGKKTFGVVRKIDDIGTNKKDRYFTKPEEIIKLGDGTEVAVCNQWAITNIEDFIREAQNKGFSISKV